MGAFFVVALVIAVIVVVRMLAASGAAKPVAGARIERARTTSALGDAIVAGDRVAIRKLLTSGSDPNDAADEDLPALHTALMGGATGLVRTLLDAGAEIDHADPKLGSALALAIARGDDASARLLIDAGIDLDLTNDGGASALHMAAYVGRLEIVRALLDRGVTVDRPNFTGGTPLRSAADRGHAAIVALLIERGADPHVVDDFDKTPADYAAAGHHDAVLAVLEKAAPDEERRASVGVRRRGPSEHLLPARQDATLGGVRTALERGSKITGVAASSLEAPSCVYAARDLFGPTFEIGVGGIDDPDPQQPIRPVRFLLWKYASKTRPERALPAPSKETAAKVRALAITPYSESPWRARAMRVAAGGDEATLRDLLAAMIHPGACPPYLEAWDWWFRNETAAAMLIAFAEASPWEGSLRREVLYDLVDGPADWTNTAAILALTAVARHDESASTDIRAKLLETARRKPTPPAFQHAIEPAAYALLELGGLAPDVEAELDALVRG